MRRRHRGPYRGADDPAAPDGRHRRGLRARVRADQPGSGPASSTRSWRRRPGRGDLAARRRPGQPDRPDRRAGPGRATARRAGPRADPGHRHPAPRTARSPACAPTAATSRPRSSSTARASGPRRSAPCAGSPCRCTRPSTSTWSPTRSTASDRTCRSCATPTATPTSRRRSAAWSSVASSPRPSRGSRPTQLPYPFEFQLLDEDWDHFSILMESALHRIPALAADRDPQVLQRPGELHPRQPVHPRRGTGAAELLRRRRASTRSASRRPAAPGRALAEWIVDGEPARDLSAVDIRRFAAFNGNTRWLHDRVGEVLGLHYAIPWPNRELETARPVPPLARLSPARPANACFGAKMGWERANFFAPPGAAPGHRVLLGQAELAALVRGRAAGRPARRRGLRPDLVLQVPGDRRGRRGGAPVAVHRRRRRRARPDRLHRACSTSAARYEADITVTRLSADEFLLVSQRGSDRARRRPHHGGRSRPSRHACLVDVTSAYAVYGVMGRGSRELLPATDPQPTSRDEAFPFGTSRAIDLGYSTVRATRITYVGRARLGAVRAGRVRGRRSTRT